MAIQSCYTILHQDAPDATKRGGLCLSAGRSACSSSSLLYGSALARTAALGAVGFGRGPPWLSIASGRRDVPSPQANKRLPIASSEHLGKLVGHGRRWPAGNRYPVAALA